MIELNWHSHWLRLNRHFPTTPFSQGHYLGSNSLSYSRWGTFMLSPATFKNSRGVFISWSRYCAPDDAGFFFQGRFVWTSDKFMSHRVWPSVRFSLRSPPQTSTRPKSHLFARTLLHEIHFKHAALMRGKALNFFMQAGKMQIKLF